MSDMSDTPTMRVSLTLKMEEIANLRALRESQTAERRDVVAVVLDRVLFQVERAEAVAETDKATPTTAELVAYLRKMVAGEPALAAARLEQAANALEDLARRTIPLTAPIVSRTMTKPTICSPEHLYKVTLGVLTDAHWDLEDLAKVAATALVRHGLGVTDGYEWSVVNLSAEADAQDDDKRCGRCAWCKAIASRERKPGSGFLGPCTMFKNKSIPKSAKTITVHIRSDQKTSSEVAA